MLSGFIKIFDVFQRAIYMHLLNKILQVLDEKIELNVWLLFKRN